MVHVKSHTDESVYVDDAGDSEEEEGTFIINDRVVRKQRRMAISPATLVTCAVSFFARSKKYSSIQSKHAKLMKY